MIAMDYQPLGFGRMQECGSSLLKALQNESMIPLDLLVRESVQNSLDAAAELSTVVSVAFDFLSHDGESMASILGGPVSSRIREVYRSGSHRLLVIRDRHTSGLTGPLAIEEVPPDSPHGNFVKLVYEIGRSQEATDKGGSWGLGKTVYFRAGAGLVFFYSRIESSEGVYQERLAACLVEDERRKDRLLGGNRTGIAWWGRGETKPLSESAEIGHVLKKLGVERFSGEETGTAVVIPFLRGDLGPPRVDEEDLDAVDESPAREPWWHRSYEEYLSVAVQKWYGIRLNNRRFKGPALEVAINGVSISDEQVLPLFKLARGLYLGCIGAGSTCTVRGANGDAVEVTVREIGPLNVAFEGAQSAGRVAFALVTKDQLGMTPPNNQPSPHEVLTGRSQAGAALPLVAFLRGHGMVIRWDDRGDSSGWAKGVGPVLDGKFLIALVVPRSELHLHRKVKGALRNSPVPTTLEEYLRSCEKADHHQWTDHVGVTIVRRMRERVARTLKEAAPKQVEQQAVTTPVLAARTIADRLLPEGFGTDGRTRPRVSAGETAPHPRRSGQAALPQLEVEELKYHRGGVFIRWRLTWAGKPTPCTLRLLVDTEQKPLTRDAWENDTNGEGLGRFPLSIREVTAEPVAAECGSREQSWDVTVTPLGHLPGVRFVPRGSKLKRGFTFGMQGVLDVDATSKVGSPIRAVLAVERYGENLP